MLMSWNKTYKKRKGRKTGQWYQWFILKKQFGDANVQIIVDEGRGHYPDGKRNIGPAAECNESWGQKPWYPSPVGIAMSMNGTAEFTATDLADIIAEVGKCQKEMEELRNGFESDS